MEKFLTKNLQFRAFLFFKVGCKVVEISGREILFKNGKGIELM